ncbi:MAG: hypothetical protein WCD57_17080 [Acidobacteriaceae bacterium]
MASIQPGRSQYTPSDISSVQVMFDNGSQANGDWLYGRFFNVYVVPESTITRWRYI